MVHDEIVQRLFLVSLKTEVHAVTDFASSVHWAVEPNACPHLCFRLLKCGIFVAVLSFPFIFLL